MKKLINPKTPYITVLLIALNILYFLYLELIGSTEQAQFMIRYGAMYAPLIMEDGEYYRLFTSFFMHFDIHHLTNNMVLLYIFGEHLELVLGRVKYVILYLLCGIGANIVSLKLEMADYGRTVGAGASGAVFGLAGALFIVIARNHGQLKDLSIRRMAVMICFSLYLGFTSSGVDNAAHVGGLLLGMLLALLLYRRQ